MLKKIIFLLLIVGVLLASAGALAGWYAYNFYARDLPQMERVTDYRMNAVSSVFAGDNTLVAEFFEEQRYPISIKDVPPLVRNAFLASEDAGFYSHPGIDLISIVRAAVKNIQTGSSKQGGSTITQQVVKNILLTREKKLDRKIKEAILSYRLEKRLTKDDILELYLNQIFFGNRAFGIKAAAQNYFNKSVQDLNLAEAAMLAGLPQAPSRYSPVSNLPAAKNRQRYVLNQMVKAKFVSAKAAKQAAEQELTIYKAPNDRLFAAPYYVTEVRRLFEEQWRDYRIDLDGLKIYTALDIQAYGAAERALHNGLREVDKRQGWRGAIGRVGSELEYLQTYAHKFLVELQANTPYPAMVKAVNKANQTLTVQLNQSQGIVDLKKSTWSKKIVGQDSKVRWGDVSQELKTGDIIEVSFPDGSEYDLNTLLLDQSPRLEGAVVILNPQNGHVVAVVGGYDYQRSQFNRATQGKRQPGSAFKPILYLAAIESFGYTPSTIVVDAPNEYRVGDTVWAPNNYELTYLGSMTLRTALEKSRNSISAELIARMGPEIVVKYAKRLGIESPMGVNLSLALGSSEVTPLEITRSYGVFANNGVLFPSVFITRIEDRYGNIIFDYQQQKLKLAERVISEASAFVMSNMLKGVVQSGTGTKIKELMRPAAGKTGTSNDQMDAWFVGFTPEWACGVWVGHDEKEPIGVKETGGRVAAPIWLHSMQKFLDYRDQLAYQVLIKESNEDAARLGIEIVKPEPIKPLDFSIPEGVEPAWIDKTSGQQTIPSSSGAFLEYYIKGSGPNDAQVPSTNQDYWALPDF